MTTIRFKQPWMKFKPGDTTDKVKDGVIHTLKKRGVCEVVTEKADASNSESRSTKRRSSGRSKEANPSNS